MYVQINRVEYFFLIFEYISKNVLCYMHIYPKNTNFKKLLCLSIFLIQYQFPLCAKYFVCNIPYVLYYMLNFIDLNKRQIIKKF